MNTKTKKHWYDKPLKFLYFLAVLFPFALLLGNYISCQLQFDKQLTTRTTPYQETGTEEETYGFYGSIGGNINNPYEYNYDLELTTPTENALYYTNLTLLGDRFTNENGAEEIGVNFFENWYFIGRLEENLFKLINEHWNWNNIDTWYTPQMFLFTTTIYEMCATVAFILLKVILFLPNVIVYLLDWTERKLNV